MLVPDRSTIILGTMAGNQVILPANDKGYTYGRKYMPFWGSDNLRKRISIVGERSMAYGKNFKDIGDEYRDGRGAEYYNDSNVINKLPSSESLQGGRHFITVKNFNEEDKQRCLSCFAYALGTFGKKLEEIARKEIGEIQKSVSLTIDHVVEECFENVSEPQDGDLVVYSVSPGKVMRTPTGLPITGTTHAGIYRAPGSDGNSPRGGSIESKWGWLANSYVFQHDVFFTPDFYGDQVKFYRLKKSNN